MITVVTNCTDHRISTFHQPAFIEPSVQLEKESSPGQNDEGAAAATEHRNNNVKLAEDSSQFEGGERVMVGFTFYCSDGPL